MELLTPDTTYHIFNHANGFENVFREPENYRYFLEKYRLYISPIAETYAYCLMPNHFHLVVRIRKREIIETLIYNKKSIELNSSNSSNSNFSKVLNFGKVDFGSGRVDFKKVEENKPIIGDYKIEKFISKQFANLFSCYTQSFNKVFERMGSLFIKNFKRRLILGIQDFLDAIIYVHRNPVHHRFRDHYGEWDYSSYLEIINNRSNIVEVEKLLRITNGIENFIDLHHLNLQKFNCFDET